MSGCKIIAKVGNKSIEKNVCRPNFEEVLEPYVEITRTHKNNKEKGVWYAAEYIFGKIGGQLLREFEVAKKANNENYVNTCAARISWALNHNSSEITINTFKLRVKRTIQQNKQPQTVWRGYKGIDGLTYYISVDDIIDMLSLNWGKLNFNEIDKYSYEILRESMCNGQSKDFVHKMATTSENKDFFNDFAGEKANFGKDILHCKQQGIIAIKGINLMTKIGFGHTTLWDQTNFVDVLLQENGNFLTNDNYLVKEVYYWDLG